MIGILVVSISVVIGLLIVRSMIPHVDKPHELHPVGFQQFECTKCHKRVSAISPSMTCEGIYGYFDWPQECDV